MEQSYRDHLAAVKRQIREQTPAETAARLAARPAPAILDVRERDEYEQGYIPGAVHIPRGNLESRIENTVSDRNAPVILYCAAGDPSPPAPISSTFDSSSRSCPASPTSGISV